MVVMVMIICLAWWVDMTLCALAGGYVETIHACMLQTKTE